MNKITRVEVIGPKGREYVGYFEEGIEARASLQDERRTLKIFLDTANEDRLHWED